MLWRLRAFYIMTRRLLNYLLHQLHGLSALWLVLASLLLPIPLAAKTRRGTPHARQPHAPQGHNPARHHQPPHARHTAADRPAANRGRKHGARLTRAALTTRMRPSPHKLSAPAPQMDRPVAVQVSPSGVARSAFEASRSALPLAPDRNDADALPAGIPVPVVSIIRPTTDHPQLPSIEDAAATPVILPALYDKSGRLVVPPALRGSHEILLHQNEVADRDGLARIQDDSDLEWMRRRAMLVPLPTGGALRVDDRLPANRRYCRPWTAQFLATLSRAYYVQFHIPLQVNSAVRTVSFQQRLLRTNGNAAPAAGETASPHLTGQAIDLAKRGLSLSQIAWLRGYLLPLVQQGKIDVEEEFQQACFHISVYKSYGPTDPSPRHEIAVTHRDRPAALAIAVQ